MKKLGSLPYKLLCPVPISTDVKHWASKPIKTWESFPDDLWPGHEGLYNKSQVSWASFHQKQCLYMEMLLNSVNWVEIPVTDFDRAKKFYSVVYDYEMPEMQMGPNRMGFFLFDREKGGVGAAIVQGENYVPSKQGPKVYLNAGKDLNTVLSRLEQAGGKLVLAKRLIAPQMGYMACFEDSEGNEIWLYSLQ